MDEVTLPAKQQAIFDALKGAGDVSIDVLFKAIGGPADYEDPKRKQQWCGSYLTRINRRLRNHGLQVKPGERKRTYRLSVV